MITFNIRTDYHTSENSTYGCTYIICEYPNGSRFKLTGSTLTHDDTVHDTESVILRQEARIKKIEQHVASAGKINHEYWEETYPEYGSEAYLTRPTLEELLKKYS